jgi:hypothetical protein
MNVPRCQAEDYIDFLVATPKHCTATEAARVQPEQPRQPAHDAFTRLLHRLEPDPATLWVEAQPHVDLEDGVLILDDSTLDKPYANEIQLVARHWSGKHRAVVQGISLVSLLWTDGDRHIPCDYRIYHKATDGLTKNDHAQAMLLSAHERGFRPKCVLFDGWYSSLENLKTIRSLNWNWLTRLKSNRKVRVDRGEAGPLACTPIAASGTEVWLVGYGLIRVFKVVAPDGDIVYWATSDLTMTELTRQQYAEYGWAIENYHKGIKQCTQVERCQVRSARGQRNHIGLALRAFLRLSVYSFRRGISWLEAKVAITRSAVRAYLSRPYINLATA